jgi:hypothetical protein
LPRQQDLASFLLFPAIRAPKINAGGPPVNRSRNHTFRLARLAALAALALAVLGPANRCPAADDGAESGRLGYQWVDGKGGVPEGDIKRTVGITAGAVIGGLVVLGWLLKSRD